MKLIQIKTNETYNNLKEKVAETFKITQDPKNYRLRAYMSIYDTLTETFTGREDQTISKLNLS